MYYFLIKSIQHRKHLLLWQKHRQVPPPQLKINKTRRRTRSAALINVLIIINIISRRGNYGNHYIGHHRMPLSLQSSPLRNTYTTAGVPMRFHPSPISPVYVCIVRAHVCVCACAVHQRNTRSRPYRTVFGFFSHTHTIHPIFDSHTHTCKDARALVHRRSNAPRLGLVCIDSPSVHFQPTSGSWVLNHSIPPLNVNHKNNIKLCVEFARFCRHFFARCVYQP